MRRGALIGSIVLGFCSVLAASEPADEPKGKSRRQLEQQAAEVIAAGGDTKALLEQADDRFHIMQYVVNAVDKVRRAEHKSLLAAGDDTLNGTRHLWLYRSENLSRSRQILLRSLKALNLKLRRRPAGCDSLEFDDRNRYRAS